MRDILLRIQNKFNENRFDLSLEFIFLIVFAFLFFHLKKLLHLDILIFMVIYFLFDLWTMIFREKIEESDILNHDLMLFVNYASYIIITTFINIYEKDDISFITFAIIFLTVYYRYYHLVYNYKLTPFSNKTLFLIFILILITMIVITDSIYNFLLAILTCIIGLVDVKSIQKLLNIEIKEGYEIDEGKIISNKFSIIKMLLVIYPTMGIVNYIIENFHDFAGINYPDISNKDMITIISLKLILALVFYIIISEVFSRKNLKNFIESSYIKPIENKPSSKGSGKK